MPDLCDLVLSRMAKISTSTAAKKLGITPRQVARLCKAGKLNAVRPHDSGWWQVDLSKKEAGV